ncbi:MAG: hypothetical protein ACRDGN_07805 [bacterium]
MRLLRLRTTLLALGAGLALLAVACASSSEAQVVIESPAEGATVQSPVELTMSANGTGIGTPDTGNRHFHVHVDGSSEYEIVYDTSTSIELSPGQHTIEVILAEPNHEETSTTASVTVQVSGGEPTSPAPSGEDSDSGDDFGYS